MKYRVHIPTLNLPDVMPSSETLKSWRTNIHNYEPDFWEFDYETRRHLGGLTADQLARRYTDIVRNFRVFARSESHKIPIGCMFGAWYWYKKEHQTRYEFYQRKIEPPCAPPAEISRIPASQEQFQARFPDGKLIFRYGELRWMREFLKGSVRLSAAYNYCSMENDGARFDDELNKHRFMPAAYTRITTASGQDIPLKSDIRSSISAPNYYVLCTSCEWSPELFVEFKADACVVIRRPDIFAERLQAAAGRELNGWYFLDGSVLYFDPYEWTKEQPFDAPNCKDFKFAYQREYRFLWDPMDTGLPAFGHWYLNLGPLDDIAELYDRDGIRLD